MVDSRRPQEVEVEELLRNAELRNALEPFYDEAISRVNVRHLPLAVENEFLASMLAWEQAPVVPIYRWFDPELRPPRPGMLADESLHEILWDVIHRLFRKRIVLDFTEHLSDRELYSLIYRELVPSREKMIDPRPNYLHWDCTGPDRDPVIWLRFYAAEEDRELLAATYHLPLPETA